MSDQDEVKTFPCPRCGREAVTVWHVPSAPKGWCIRCFDELLEHLKDMSPIESCDKCPCGSESTDRWDESVIFCGYYDKVIRPEDDLTGGKTKPSFCMVGRISVLVRPDVDIRETDQTQWYAINGDGNRFPIESPVDPEPE